MATHAPLPWDTTPGKDVVTSARTPERTEMRERERRERERKRKREREYESQETYQNNTHHKSNNITKCKSATIIFSYIGEAAKSQKP